jgi:CheY-like chemotaxis protein
MERSELPLEGIRVLVVDDNDDMRDIVQRVLEHAGALVISFSDAAVALRSLHQVQTHVIVSDLSMPGMDGMTFLRNMRAMPGQGERPTPAIAVSAYPETMHRQPALEAGFDLYLVKPIDPELIVWHVDRVVREARGEPSRSRFFPCTHCGTQCPCPERIIRRYAGENVTRRCDSCGRLFDARMPLGPTPTPP